ncbi:sulfatase-like hydrolase/transferase, partial [candidate division KSB1 bacterium]|nr:sulfatase-like hydrolase/transferase [candidate division KSB1 bacterium]
MKNSLKRRDFIKSTSLASASLVLGNFANFSCAQTERPNILWILAEDFGMDTGCYGNQLVRTPNIDRLASEGMHCTNAFVTAPVCSPSRSALITGMYQTSIDAHQHRSHRDDGYKLPEPVQIITEYFRAAGYFTANVTTPAPGIKGTGKTDFNFNVEKPFDGTDWNQRKPGQPFYAQINFSETHRKFPENVPNP